MKIESKLSLVFLTLSVLVLILGYASLVQIDKIALPFQQDIPNSVKEINDAAELDQLANFIKYYDEVLTQSARNFAFTQDEKWLERYKNINPKLVDAIGEAIEKGDKQVKIFFSNIDEANVALVEMENLALEYTLNNNSQEAIKVLESEEYWIQKSVYEKGIEDYFLYVGGKYGEAIATSTMTLTSSTHRVRSLVNESKALILAIFFIVIFLSVSLGFFSTKSISKPIALLSKTALEIGKDNSSSKKDVKSKDELELLAQTITNMSSDLKIYEERMTDSGKKIGGEKKSNQDVNEYIQYLEKARTATLNMLEDLQKSNEKLKESDKAKSQFLNMVSHELKTPLTPIRANLDLLIGEDFGKLSEKQAKSLKTILRNIERLHDLIHNLLEISRMEAGKMVLDIRKTQLNDIAKEIVDDVTLAAREKSIKLKLDLGKIPVVGMDKGRIRECIANYVNNALKFTREGHIVIRTSVKNGFIKFEVEDSGVGVNKENVKNLFQKFYQEGKIEVGKSEGAGLGLYSVRKIVELHKGNVGVETELGKGSIFWFTLPIGGDKK